MEGKGTISAGGTNATDDSYILLQQQILLRFGLFEVNSFGNLFLRLAQANAPQWKGLDGVASANICSVVSAETATLSLGSKKGHLQLSVFVCCLD